MAIALLTPAERSAWRAVAVGLRPTWAKVELMGEVVLFGFVGHDDRRSGLLTLVEPAVDGDEEHESLSERVTHHGPGAIYRITLWAQASVMRARMEDRPMKPKPALPLTDDDIPF